MISVADEIVLHEEGRSIELSRDGDAINEVLLNEIRKHSGMQTYEHKNLS